MLLDPHTDFFRRQLRWFGVPTALKSYSCLLMCQKFAWYMPLYICLSLSVCVFICVLSRGLSLCDPMDGVPPGSSVHGFSRQEYWSGLPFPTPGGLPNPGVEPESLTSPALAHELFTIVLPQKPIGKLFSLYSS